MQLQDVKRTNSSIKRRVLMMCAPWHSRLRCHHRKKQKLADVAATESEPDVNSDELSGEDPTLSFPQQIAVAAHDHQGANLKDWSPNIMTGDFGGGNAASQRNGNSDKHSASPSVSSFLGVCLCARPARLAARLIFFARAASKQIWSGATSR